MAAGGTIDQEGCRRLEERTEKPFGLGRKLGLGKGVVHQEEPAIAGAFIDQERKMAHAQTGMAAVLEVPRGSAKSKHQEISETSFGLREIAPSVKRPKDIVLRDLAVKGPDEAFETRFADLGVEIFFEQVFIVSSLYCLRSILSQVFIVSKGCEAPRRKKRGDSACCALSPHAPLTRFSTESLQERRRLYRWVKSRFVPLWSNRW